MKKYIGQLKSNKSPGSDGLPNEVLKALSPSIAHPLCLLFNLSFATGTFPAAWKSAIVTPIYKGKGSQTNPSNYRPISLLPSISKLCERVFYDKLYQHVNPSLSPLQSGFRRKDGTAFQVARLVQDIYTARNLKKHAGVCFFDISKAFDTVWHRGLLYKLEADFGVNGNALAWLHSYLSQRQQRVKVSGILSDPCVIGSGVPQGSILGPLLFIIYTNDLSATTDGVSLFADDTSMLKIETCAARLHKSLQAGIDSVIGWMTKWKLRPNCSKTEVMYFGPDPPHPPLYFPNSLDPIKSVMTHKHLGIVFDSSLSWLPHIDYICSRTSSALGMLRHHCSHLVSPCKSLFYKCYILPILDYCDIAWIGLSQTALDRLETHNRLLLKILYNKDRTFPSADLYHITNTTPLEFRRKCHSCQFVHKILLGKAPPHIQLYNWFNGMNTRSRVSLPRAFSTLFTNSPFFISYSNWLRLPEATKVSRNLLTFRM